MPKGMFLYLLGLFCLGFAAFQRTKLACFKTGRFTINFIYSKKTTPKV